MRNASRPRRTGRPFWLVVTALVLSVSLGCSGGGGPKGTSDPEAKLRLEKLLELYRMHISQKQKGPANEQAFKEFISKLSPDEKASLQLPENLDSLFVSPRDNQKYVIRYGLAHVDPAGELEAIMWEETGQNGKRYVALSNGYVDEKDQADFDTLKKK